jgi:hypothetical protein
MTSAASGKSDSPREVVLEGLKFLFRLEWWQAYNPSHLEGKDWEDCGSSPARRKDL